MIVKGNHFCWASFCGNWCSAISLDHQPALHLPKISPLICVYMCHSMLIPFLPFPLVLWETEGIGPCDLVLQFSCIYVFTCLTSVLSCPCSNLLCCVFPLCYFLPIAPPLLCFHALPPHGVFSFLLCSPSLLACNEVTIASS